MLKRLILFVWICFIFSSCGTSIPTSVVFDVDSTNSNISFNIDKNVYKYKLSYKENMFVFSPIDTTTPIEFSVDDGVLFSLNNDIKHKINLDSIIPVPVLIIKALETSSGIKAAPDYNGKYKIYGTLREGEYVLLLNRKGKPELLSIENLNLNVEFS